MKIQGTLAGLMIFCTAGLASPPVLAQSEPALGIAHRLMVRSGLSVQLRGVSKQVLERLEAHRGALPADAAASLASAAKEAFRAEVLQEDVVSTLASAMKREDMEKALVWLETDAGRRVAVAEELASVTMSDASMRSYAKELKKKPLSERRMKLISATIEGSYGVESAVQIYESTALGVAVGIDSTQPLQKRLGAKRPQARLKATMPTAQWRAGMQQAMPMIYAYTYRNVSDADMAAYTIFLTSPAGQRYHEGILEAVEGAMARASVRLGQLLEPPGKKHKI